MLIAKGFFSLQMKYDPAKFLFILSFGVLSFMYGTLVGKWEYFPHSFLSRAMDQARKVLGQKNIDTHDQVFDRKGVRTYSPKKMKSGMTAITSWWKGPDGLKVGMKLIDGEGRILHEWLVDRGKVFEGAFQRKDPTETDVHGSLLLPNGDVCFNLEYVGAVRLNSCGEVLWTQTEGNHHSIARGKDGTFWIPGVSRRKRTGSDEYPDGFPGLESVWVNRILHLSGDGEILADIAVLDLLYANDLERFLFQHARTSGDVTHVNDVEPLSSSLSDEYPLFEAGDLLISLRNINLVFVVVRRQV